MKGLKETLNGWRSGLFGTAHTVADRIDAKWHVREHAVNVNEWAEENPKRFFRISMTAIVVIFIGGCISIYFSNNNFIKPENVENFQEIPNIASVFDMQNINDARVMTIKDKYTQTVEQIQQVSHELDSLMKLPERSHADSVRISRLYRIYKSLNMEIQP